MSDESDNPLTFATTDELIHEIQRRSECMVIAYEPHAGGNGLTIQHSGGVFSAIGLLYVSLENVAGDLRTVDDD